MCIRASVGRGGVNTADDVRIIQLLLQLNPDGICGPATCAAIAAYQDGVSDTQQNNGTILPDDAALDALRHRLPAGFTPLKLQAIALHATASAIERYFAPLSAAMSATRIDTPLRQAHFLAQLAHESGDLRYTEELASGAEYEGRNDLGNTQTGDGPRFKGRGLIQLTGRANYAAFGASIGRDLTFGTNTLQLATDPLLAVQVATWFWQQHGLTPLADADDLAAITRRINGGINGLPDRKEKLRRAKFFLLATSTPVQKPGAKLPAQVPTLHAVSIPLHKEAHNRL